MLFKSCINSIIILMSSLIILRTTLSYRLSSLRMISSFNRPETTNKRDIEKIRTLLADVTDVISSTGISPVFTRTIQASKVVTKLIGEYVKDPKDFNDANNKISAPIVLRKLFEGLGATYIKLGQFIASSPTLFPSEYVIEFQSCLDNTPPVPYSEIRKIIQEDLGRPLSSIYSFIDPVPLATASIAQVHRAKLLNGTDVVIKVRKPDVESILKADLGFIYVTSKLIEFINPELSRVSLGDIVGDLRSSMLSELDFKVEAANLDSFRLFLEKQNIVDATAPCPYHAASSTRVLTMDYLKGVPLADLEGIRKYSSNPELTLITALRTWAASVAEHTFFHADVHAGNLLVLEDGRVGFIDFGIVGNLSTKVLTSIEEAVENFAKGDFRGVAKALTKMGATSEGVDVEAFGNDLQNVVDRLVNISPDILLQSDLSGMSVSARLTVDQRETTQIALDIVEVAERNGLKLPREFGLLLKQSLYFDRYLKLLAPSLDPLTDLRVRGGGGSSGGGDEWGPSSSSSGSSNEANLGVGVGRGGARKGEGERRPSSGSGSGRVIDVDAIIVN